MVAKTGAYLLLALLLVSNVFALTYYIYEDDGQAVESSAPLQVQKYVAADNTQNERKWAAQADNDYDDYYLLLEHLAKVELSEYYGDYWDCRWERRWGDDNRTRSYCGYGHRGRYYDYPCYNYKMYRYNLYNDGDYKDYLLYRRYKDCDVKCYKEYNPYSNNDERVCRKSCGKRWHYD